MVERVEEQSGEIAEPRETEREEKKYTFQDTGATGGCVGVRHLQCVLMFAAILLCYCLRVNMSVAIVAMTHRAGAHPDYPEYEWKEGTKSLILSSFFWGYVMTQVFAGVLAQKVGAKPLLLTAVALASLFSLLTPLGAARGGWGLVCALRVCQGLAQGFLFPSLHTLLAKWAPVAERGTLVTFVYSGAQLGTVISLPACGLLSTSAAGWPSTFYVFGGLGLGWSLLWLALGSNSPAEDRLISVQERAYIEDSLRTSDTCSQELPVPWKPMMTSAAVCAIVVATCGHWWGFWTLLTNFMASVLLQELPVPWKPMMTSAAVWAIVVATCGHWWGFWTLLTNFMASILLQELPVPWKPMMTSAAVWAIVVATCGHWWGFWTLLTTLPNFMASILHFDLKTNGMLSALPYLAMFLLSLVFSRLSDYVTNRNLLTKTTARKMFNSIGIFTPGVTLIALGYSADSTTAITLLTIAIGVNSAIYVGFFVNHIELTPNFAGTLMGIANGLGNLMSIFGPLVVGVVVQEATDVTQWRTVFFIASAVYFVSGVVYLIFGSAELQPWNDAVASQDVALAVFSVDLTRRDDGEGRG